METEPTPQWGIVELMGRKVVAGKISKSTIYGPELLQVDVPATSAFPAYSQFYGATAIYCVTPVSEEVARRTAEEAGNNPVSVYVPDLVTREQYAELQEKVIVLRNELDKRPALTEGEQTEEEDDDTSDDPEPEEGASEF